MPAKHRKPSDPGSPKSGNSGGRVASAPQMSNGLHSPRSGKGTARFSDDSQSPASKKGVLKNVAGQTARGKGRNNKEETHARINPTVERNNSFSRPDSRQGDRHKKGDKKGKGKKGRTDGKPNKIDNSRVPGWVGSTMATNVPEGATGEKTLTHKSKSNSRTNLTTLNTNPSKLTGASTNAEGSRSQPSMYVVSRTGEQQRLEAVEGSDHSKWKLLKAISKMTHHKGSSPSRIGVDSTIDEAPEDEIIAGCDSTAYVGIVEFIGVTWQKNSYCTIVLTSKGPDKYRDDSDDERDSKLRKSKESANPGTSAKGYIRSIVESALPSEVFFIDMDRDTTWYISIKVKKAGLGGMLRREVDSIHVPFLTNGEVPLSGEKSIVIRSGWLTVHPTRQGVNLGLQGLRYRIRWHNKAKKKWADGYVVIQIRDSRSTRICLANEDSELQRAVDVTNIECVAGCCERYTDARDDGGYYCRVFYWETEDNEAHETMSRLRLMFLSQLDRVSFVERLLMRIDNTNREPRLNNLQLFVGTWNAGNAQPQTETYQKWIPRGMDMYCLTAQELVWLQDDKLTNSNKVSPMPSATGRASDGDVTHDEAPSSPQGRSRVHTYPPNASDVEEDHLLPGKDKKPGFGGKMAKVKSLAKSASSSECGIEFNRKVAARLGVGYVMLCGIVNYDRVMCVLVHWRLFGLVEETELSSCLLAKFGNKGAVACKVKIRLNPDIPTSLTFAGAHLSAGEDLASYYARNNNYRSICETLTFKDDQGVEFPENGDACFVSGDFNYRLTLKAGDTRKDIVDRIAAKKAYLLKDSDELLEASSCGFAFPRQIWKEGPVTSNFPTYKLDPSKTDEHAKLETKFATADNVFHYDTSRVPAWCDRILWRPVSGTVEVRQTQLDVSAVHGKSDHAPLGAVFTLRQRPTPPKYPWKLMCPDDLVVTLNSLDGGGKFLRVRFVGDFIEENELNPAMTSLSQGTQSGTDTGVKVYKWDPNTAYVPQVQIAPPLSKKMSYATPLRVVLLDGLKQTRGHAMLPFENAKKTTLDTRGDVGKNKHMPASVIRYAFAEPLIYRGLIVGEISVNISME